jgi:hypothetical protein
MDHCHPRGRGLAVKRWVALAALLAGTGCEDGALHAFETRAVSVAGLLDDFEDADVRAGSDGWWYATDDGTGPAAAISFPRIDEREGSSYAARLEAGPTLDYGAFLGLDVPGGVYDASAFDTLTFAARADPPFTLSVTFLDKIFEPYEANVEVDGEWREVAVPLSAFVREGAVLDSSRITHLQFWWRGPGPAFELWIDDVGLTVTQ